MLLKSVPVSLIQVVMGGAMKMGNLLFAGGQDRQPQMSSQSSYLACAPPFASCLTASLANGLKCTVTCKLQDCNNWQENNSTVQNRDSEDSSDDKDL